MKETKSMEFACFLYSHHTAFHNYLPTQRPRISILIYTESDPVQVQVNITSISKSIQEMHWKWIDCWIPLWYPYKCPQNDPSSPLESNILAFWISILEALTDFYIR